MRVMLLAPPIMDDLGSGLENIAMDAYRECPPYGIYLLRQALRGAGHQVTLIDLVASGSATLPDIRLEDFGLVAIGATSMSWPTALHHIARLKERAPQLPIVVGGIHPTMFDWYILASFAVDYVVRGEGEVALVALANALDQDASPENVPNLTWRAPDGRILRNPAGPQLTGVQLSEAPLPDFSDLPLNVYQGLSIESSRGCAFDCSFCSTSYRRSFRGMPPSSFVDRLGSVLQYQDRTVHPFTHIIDDEFSMNVGRACSIADLLTERSVHAALVYDSRATDLLDDRFVELMAPHTYQFLVGAECGYDAGLKRIGKGTTTDTLRRAAERLAIAGISTRADFSFVIGLPWETAHEVRQTCAFALDLHERYGVRVLLQWYCQIPGSRLWQEARERGDVTEAMYNEPGFFRDLYLFRTGV